MFLSALRPRSCIRATERPAGPFSAPSAIALRPDSAVSAKSLASAHRPANASDRTGSVADLGAAGPSILLILLNAMARLAGIGAAAPAARTFLELRTL